MEVPHFRPNNNNYSDGLSKRIIREAVTVFRPETFGRFNKSSYLCGVLYL